MAKTLDDLWCIPAPAKLNLFLHITGVREDGYHDLQTVFQLLDYADDVFLKRRMDGQIYRTCGLEDVNPADDLVVKAAKALKAHTGTAWGVDVGVTKRLPVGGGIGGGSSDAASTLMGLNKLWQCGLTQAELLTLARSLGADVPVFVNGKNAWAEGIGDQLTEIYLPEKWYLVIHPNVHISTAKLFSSDELTRDNPILRIRDFPDTDTSNTFEAVARKQYPEVDLALQWLGSYSKAKMTGTGSCVFAAFDSFEVANKVLVQVPENWSSFITKSVAQSPMLDEVSKIPVA
ncbi:MAG: 4-(cytidine 5'-diphospho)-2-C-methyl-D-erythritol kinase [Leucothrix sp.]